MPWPGMDPDLPSCVFEIVDQEDFALSARREVRQNAARRQHVQAAPDQCLEQLHPGCKFMRLDLKARAFPTLEMIGQPHMRINAQNVQVADFDVDRRVSHGAH